MLDSIESEKYNIICLSNQIWNFPFPTNKKHVMSRLSKLGHRVLFVDPPINTGRLFARQLISKKWPIKRLISSQFEDGGVRVYSPLNVMPFDNISSKLHVDKIRKIQKDYFDKDKKTILWVYHVEIGGLKYYLDNLDCDLLVYDCVDNYSGFPKYDTSEKKASVDKKEEMLTKRADVVFATAPGLVDKLQGYGETVYYTPNVGDYGKFKDSKKFKDQLPEELEVIPRPRIAFTGAVDVYKFDSELVKKIAGDHPKYSFIIMGSMALDDREASADELGFEDFQNIHFLGSRPYEEIHKYFAGFDVFIIPYQLNDYTVGGCFPVKFHDGLAAGLPVVVTNLPAYAPFTDVCYISKDYDEFSSNVKFALEEDNPQRVKDRQEVAEQNNWDGKVSKMLKIVSKSFRL